jgi:hypothetical protein
MKKFLTPLAAILSVFFLSAVVHAEHKSGEGKWEVGDMSYIMWSCLVKRSAQNIVAAAIVDRETAQAVFSREMALGNCGQLPERTHVVMKEKLGGFTDYDDEVFMLWRIHVVGEHAPQRNHFIWTYVHRNPEDSKPKKPVGKGV